VYPDERVARFVTENFIPARVHVRDQAADFQRLGARYNAQWTPTILELDPDGTERHRIEGFLDAGEFLAQLALGLAHGAFQRREWAEAERRFREVVDRFPRTDAAPEALYWAGAARFNGTHDPAALSATAAAFADRYQDSAWARKASVWAA
jgi:TolA-binding protein